MSESDQNPGDPGAAGREPHDPPLTVELLADLQAGLLDDDAAARVRGLVRTDPEASGILGALNRVRSNLAAVSADLASAPDPPPAVTAEISAALRSASARGPRIGGAAHSARPQVGPTKVIAAVAGLGAVVAAIGVGTAALIDAPASTPAEPATAQHITVSTPPPVIPLSEAQILDLLHRAPEFGSLGDAARRASCLSGLGYPASTTVLGAQLIDVNARPAVLLVLPGDTPDKLAVFAVTPYCSAVNTGLLATTGIPRP
ncbi:hypothetical protein [Mycobacterium haemophilum]